MNRICSLEDELSSGLMSAVKISVPIGDGGNPSPLGEARLGVTWSRATLPVGRAHEERPEGPSGVDSEISESSTDGRCSSSCARPTAADCRRTRVGDRVREGRARPRSPTTVLPTESARESDGAMAEGISSRVLLQEFPHLKKKFWGRHFWARGYLAVSSGTITDEMIREYIEEQEGEQVPDDSRFPIDNT